MSAKDAGGSKGKSLIAIRIRGFVKENAKESTTLKNLGLTSVNSCTILPATGTSIGMLKRVSGYVTWGNADAETVAKILEKRGRDATGKAISDKDARKIAEKILSDGIKSAGISPVIHLRPPAKGLKTVKLYCPEGDLGGRGDKIKNLALRMI